MKIHKGDTVLVISGKEKGKTGRVERVLTSKDRVVIEGINMTIRHMRPRPGVRQAGRVQQESPLPSSNVMLICNKCGKPTRIASGKLDDGRKVRECKRCRETIE